MNAQNFRRQSGLPWFPSKKRKGYKIGNYHSTSIGASSNAVFGTRIPECAIGIRF
jgi:hypothetical protein